tara:strand:- start:374 stop:571 length:198 start_codon:yes stop_codon:yes gene_type:complete
MNIKWTQADKQFIKDHAWNVKDKDLAIELSERNQRSVSIDAVRKLRQRMGIFKKSGRGRCELKEL